MQQSAHFISFWATVIFCFDLGLDWGKKRSINTRMYMYISRPCTPPPKLYCLNGLARIILVSKQQVIYKDKKNKWQPENLTEDDIQIYNRVFSQHFFKTFVHLLYVFLLLTRWYGGLNNKLLYLSTYIHPLAVEQNPEPTVSDHPSDWLLGLGANTK